MNFDQQICTVVPEIFVMAVLLVCAGVGGHGGAGIHADLQSKYQEIAQRVSLHATPEPRNTVELTPGDSGGDVKVTTTWFSSHVNSVAA